MTDRCFEDPILNSPHKDPYRFRQLDAIGLLTQRIVESRRRAGSITPIPDPSSGRIAVNVVNDLGEEVKMIFRIGL